MLKKDDSASLKSDIDKLEIDKREKITKISKLDADKLVPAPIGSKNLSDAVNKEVIKKDLYGKLVNKVNAIQTSDIVIYFKKLNITQRPKIFNRKLLIMIMIIMLIPRNLIN